ncbi:hypothetical protein O7635_27710 [Asanoa sp. WMMD1127]|uniref:hypothetical protein n=1 Tax=Asanoa sp. WMMD1127 TaxID=3016107 RepID=UPI0024178BAE|nr:hypothetical protein [Asanoa sp. WMMD1127]MDG4825650.1 hypothetical protein [Asanoa sp. WMMD1127]
MDVAVAPARVTTAAAGGLVLVCALAASAAAAVPGRNERANGLGTEYGWNYPFTVWPMLACLAAAGLVIAWRRPGWARPAAVVAAIVGAQVAGFGVVAVRDWFNVNGAWSMGQHNLATVVTFAAGVAVCGAVATCVAVGVVWREPDDWRPGRPAQVGLGAVVAVGLPLELGLAFGDPDITSLGQYALTYSLPWGVALAATGWLDRTAALAARATVAGSAVLVTLAGWAWH